MEKIALNLISPRDYDKRVLTPEEILCWFGQEDAYWAYPEEPSPEWAHAELVSGLCSDGYFDVPRVLKFPNIAEILGRQLARRLREANEGEFSWVVSSAYSAITFGHEVAKALHAVFMNTEKDPADPKKQLWQRMTIPAGVRVLQIEELITTTGTLEQVRQAIERGNAESVYFLSTAGTLVLRPPKLMAGYGGRKIIALIEKEMKAFDPKECPYCKAGSPRYRPKTHWEELTRKR